MRETIAPIVETLTAVIAAVESQPADGPAWKAFQSAIRRNGEEAAAAGGSDAMEGPVLHAVADAAPDRSERRETIICAAWVGLPGWRS
jgi:hypothetical protein